MEVGRSGPGGSLRRLSALVVPSDNEVIFFKQLGLSVSVNSNSVACQHLGQTGDQIIPVVYFLCIRKEVLTFSLHPSVLGMIEKTRLTGQMAGAWAWGGRRQLSFELS